MIAVAVTCARPAAADDQFLALAGVAGAVLAVGVAGEMLDSDTVFIAKGTTQIDAVAGLGFYGLFDGHLPDRQYGLGTLEVRFAPIVGVRPIIGARLPIQQAGEAHQQLTSSKVTGKVVLTV